MIKGIRNIQFIGKDTAGNNRYAYELLISYHREVQVQLVSREGILIPDWLDIRPAILIYKGIISGVSCSAKQFGIVAMLSMSESETTWCAVVAPLPVIPKSREMYF